MKTGIQVSSLKPLLRTEAQVGAAFEKMASMGVDTVQLQWIDPAVSPEAIAASMARHRIKSVSVQDFTQSILENKDYYYRLNAVTGGTWLCPSRVPEELKSPEGLVVFARELQAMGDELAELGQRLCFHPVAADFAPVGGVCPVEFLMERLPWLEICFDLYHLNKAGFDMPAWIRRYAGRVCMVHFKEGKRRPDGTEVLVPAGQGDIDWTGTVESCLETGVPYAFVEQERWDRDPYDCLGEALRWLNGQMT